VNENIFTVAGNVASDVRYLVTQSGTPVASFRVAATHRFFDRRAGRWADGETLFATVTCWRQLAENVARSVAKGQPVLLSGRARFRTWESETKGPGADLDIEALWVAHDLTRGTATFVRTPRRAEPVPESDAAEAEALRARVHEETEEDPAGYESERVAEGEAA
jgi:single-strand DNA-binding protein